MYVLSQLRTSLYVSVFQLNLFQNLTVASQKSLKVAPGESVHHIMTFDPSDRDYIYLMTSNHVSVTSGF